MAFVAHPQLWQILGRSVLLALLAAIMTAIFYRIEHLSYQNYVRELELDATVQVIEARERIEEEVFQLALVMNELATVIGEHPTINGAEFNMRASDYVFAHPEVRAFSATPNDGPALFFANSLNGDRYRDVLSPDQSAKAARVPVRARFSSPIEMPDGEQVLILTKPVYAQIANQPPSYWGRLSVALNRDQFLRTLNIPALEERFDLLIREISPGGREEPTIIFGDPDILNRAPIDLAFNFPFGQWHLMATPDGGWPIHRPNFVSIWLERALLMMVCLISLWYVMSLLDRRRQAEKLLSEGIEALDHGFVMFDADRRLVAYNKKYKQLAGGSGMVRLGVRYEDIVKANLEQGLIPDAVGKEQQWYAEWSKRLEIREVDKEQILADGRMIRAYDRPLEDGGMVGLRIDVTEFKKAQIAAEAANKAKTDFMGVLSHELRTPLTVILGHAQLAKNIERMPVYTKLVQSVQQHPDMAKEVLPQCEALSAQITRMMEALERSGNHLFTLISEILDFAKIDSGTLSMDMQRLKTDGIVSPIVDQMRPMIEEKGLTVTLEQETCEVIADNQRIQQVLINLIGNATKFTDEGGITVRVRTDADSVYIDVSDTGIGIPEDQVKKVFEAFHQVDSSSGRKYGGTGLGLAISADIARAHSGELSAKSEIGTGSTFTLRLPLPHTDSAPKIAEPPEDAEKQAA